MGGKTDRMTTPHLKELENQIEHVVRQYFLQAQKVAMEAVARTFAAVSCEQQAKPIRAKEPGPPTILRRNSEEMEVLTAKLYEVICAHPGETITQLSPKVGVTIKELKTPSARLKRTGRLRTTGQRQFTRYFPIAVSEPM
jgi:hypothetical protein